MAPHGGPNRQPERPRSPLDARPGGRLHAQESVYSTDNLLGDSSPDPARTPHRSQAWRPLPCRFVATRTPPGPTVSTGRHGRRCPGRPFSAEPSDRSAASCAWVFDRGCWSHHSALKARPVQFGRAAISAASIAGAAEPAGSRGSVDSRFEGLKANPAASDSPYGGQVARQRHGCRIDLG